MHEDDAEPAYRDAAPGSVVPRRLSRSEWTSATAAKSGNSELRETGQPHDLDALRSVIFTSGTTGPPKGVMVTERMLLAAATATRLAARCETGDRFLMWEPLHHIGGSQLCVLALLESIRLHVIPGFSASRFWGQVRDVGDHQAPLPGRRAGHPARRPRNARTTRTTRPDSPSARAPARRRGDASPSASRSPSTRSTA